MDLKLPIQSISFKPIFESFSSVMCILVQGQSSNTMWQIQFKDAKSRKWNCYTYSSCSKTKIPWLQTARAEICPSPFRVKLWQIRPSLDSHRNSHRTDGKWLRPHCCWDLRHKPDSAFTYRRRKRSRLLTLYLIILNFPDNQKNECWINYKARKVVNLWIVFLRFSLESYRASKSSNFR